MSIQIKKLIYCLFVLVLCGFPFPVLADVANQDLLFQCIKDKDLFLKMYTINPSKPISLVDWKKVEGIDVSKLIQQDSNGMRQKVEAIERVCGQYHVVITAGYFNSDPNREFGGIVFPVVTVTNGGQTILNEIQLGSCEKRSDINNAVNDCPDKWATAVSISPVDQGTSMTFDRSFKEQVVFTAAPKTSK